MNAKTKTYGAVTFTCTKDAVKNILVRMSKTKSKTYGSCKNFKDVSEFVGCKLPQVYQVYDKLVASGEVAMFKTKRAKAPNGSKVK